MHSNDKFDGLTSFADLVAALGKVASHQELCALNEAVDARFLKDRQQLYLSDSEWMDWTLMLAQKATALNQAQTTK